MKDLLVRPIAIPTKEGDIHGVIHYSVDIPDENRCGVVCVAGAGGGIYGPSGIYKSLAKHLLIHNENPAVADHSPFTTSWTDMKKPTPNIAVVARMDYRCPNRLDDCIYDVNETINYLHKEHKVEKFILIGWSFGGAVVLSVGAMNPKVIGVITVASQTYGAVESAKKLGDNECSALFIHGTSDTCLSYKCSEQLFQLAGEKTDRQLQLFPGDNHGITNHAKEMLDLMCNWISSKFKRKVH